jgi:hypothetical protein
VILKFRTAAGKVQQISTATSPPSIDHIRPKQSPELHQRPALTSMPLVHTEEVTQLVDHERDPQHLLTSF